MICIKGWPCAARVPSGADRLARWLCSRSTPRPLSIVSQSSRTCAVPLLDSRIDGVAEGQEVGPFRNRICACIRRPLSNSMRRNAITNGSSAEALSGSKRSGPDRRMHGMAKCREYRSSKAMDAVGETIAWLRQPGRLPGAAQQQKLGIGRPRRSREAAARRFRLRDRIARSVRSASPPSSARAGQKRAAAPARHAPRSGTPPRASAAAAERGRSESSGPRNAFMVGAVRVGNGAQMVVVRRERG